MAEAKFQREFCAWASAPELSVCADAHAAARFSFVDTLACLLLGSDYPPSQAALAAMAANGAQGPAAPIGGGAPLPLTLAALVNGARAHAMDFDDYELSGSSHASVPLYAALLALARTQPLTIDQLSEAWLVGYEAIIHMGQAIGYAHYDKGWHTTLTLGPIGAAAACARALGLDATRTGHAMALAASSAGGSLRQTGTDAKALHAGMAAELGLQATLLARAGASANGRIWDIPGGYTTLLGTPESIGFDAAIAGVTLGQAVANFPVIRKRWPSCAYTQRAIALAEQLAAELPAEAEIARIAFCMARPFRDVAHFVTPTNDAEARFSVPYCLAAGLLGGRVIPADFDSAAYNDPTRHALLAKVTLDCYELPPGDSGDIGPSSSETLTVTLADSTTHRAELGPVPAGALDPMSEDQLRQKVRDCGADEALLATWLTAPGDTTATETGLLDAAPLEAMLQ